jgi:hypothetical protein
LQIRIRTDLHSLCTAGSGSRRAFEVLDFLLRGIKTSPVAPTALPTLKVLGSRERFHIFLLLDSSSFLIVFIGRDICHFKRRFL